MILVLGVVVPLVVTAHYHALGIPRSDDWSYLVTEFRWVDGHGLSFNHWVSMNLVGQLLLAAPVARLAGRDIGALQVLVAAIGGAGLLAVLATARRTGVALAGAVLLTAGIAAGPLWAPLAVSFMTDIPAFTASALATLVAIPLVRRADASDARLTAAVALAFLGFTIRQYAIVTVIAILVTTWIVRVADRRRRRTVVAAAAVAALGAVAFWLWWRTIPDVRALSPHLPDAHAASVLASKGAGFVRLAGLLLLPVLTVSRPGARLRAAWNRSAARTLAVGAVTAAWLAVTAVRVAADLFVGNYFVHDGVLSDIVLIGPRPDVLPGPVWALIVAAASVAGVVLVVIVADGVSGIWHRARVRDLAIRDPVTLLLGLLVAGYAAAYVLAMLTGIQVYDRYVLPALPAGGILLLKAPVPAADPADAPRPAGRVGAAGLVALSGLVALGLAFTTDSASFDGARWRAAEAAVARGWPAREVNGGFEWRNYHRGDKLPVRRQGGRERICVTVHVDPHVARDRIVAVVESRAPMRGAARLVAYRTRTSCPEPSP